MFSAIIYSSCEHQIGRIIFWNSCVGTRGRARTGTAFRPRDFKSLMSTIPSRGQRVGPIPGPENSIRPQGHENNAQSGCNQRILSPIGPSFYRDRTLQKPICGHHSCIGPTSPENNVKAVLVLVFLRYQHMFIFGPYERRLSVLSMTNFVSLGSWQIATAICVRVPCVLKFGRKSDKMISSRACKTGSIQRPKRCIQEPVELAS